jgi:chromosome segregation ATPase
MTRLLLLLLTMVLSASAAESFSYIYKQGDHTHIRSSEGIEKMVALSKRWDGEYVWVRRHRRTYLIRNAAVLASVRSAFAELHAFEPSVRAAKEKLDPVERRVDALEERIDQIRDRLGDEDEDVPNRAALEAELRRAEQEMRSIEGTYRAAERESERLERESDRLEAIAEAKFEKIVLDAIDKGLAEPLR